MRFFKRLDMGVLSDAEIVELIRTTPPLLEHIIDDKIQLQPAGIDLTLKDVLEFNSAGTIDFTNKERMLSECKRISFKSGSMHLKKGVYKVIYNEIIRIPHDCIGLAFPRSSLWRCGAFLQCAGWDPGYEGRSESLLVVENKHGIKLKKNARLVQLILLKLNKKTKGTYSGTYKKENI